MPSGFFEMFAIAFAESLRMQCQALGYTYLGAFLVASEHINNSVDTVFAGISVANQLNKHKATQP